MVILFFCVVAALAFANGANDNFKGVATLWGGGDLTYRQAWFVANGATLLGAILAVYLGAEVAKTFSGKGVVNAEVLNSCDFALAFAAGAALTVLLATVFRYPISTTHSILGSLAGAGVALAYGEVNLQPLLNKGAIPLLMSPLIAASLTYVLWKMREKLFKPVFTSKPAKTISKPMHILSGTAVCFSRAVNDTPKIASIALLGGAAGISHITVYAAIGIVMTIGGMMFVKRIAEVMCCEITDMNAAEGLTANLVTAFLVIFASKLGLAVSTTHVSVGALFGIGIENGSAHKKKIFEILLSWVLTLPIAFGLAFAIAKFLAIF
ncbi:MAG: anion permease [Robiginitomaculum sp.]|nr:anion permease [Robiginitomaculum sp.]